MKRIKLKCDASTYIDEFNLNKNLLSKEYILAGVIYKNSSNFNNFKSLLEFNVSNLQTNGIEKVVLGLFVNDLNFGNSNSANIKIVGTTNNIANVTWSNYSNLISSTELITEIFSSVIGKYIEIDITNIFKEGMPYKNNYGIAIDIIKDNYTSILQFASANSAYPPYLVISVDKDKDKASENMIETKKDETSVSKVASEDSNISDKDIRILLSNFESLNSIIYTLEQSVIGKLDSLAEWIKSINIKVESLGDWAKSINTKVDSLGEWS
ncbi:MAG: DNRLRE domain-containing protein, partial [Clostridium sp.]